MKVPSLLDLGGEQQAVLDLPFDGSHVITGSAGSGKTVMALYRAWSIATAGREVVLLTHSNLLHQYLAQLAPGLTEALKVTTYHRWMRAFWDRHFRCDPPQTDEEGWSYDWIAIQRDCILGRIRSTTHLVIDEGQQLPVGFYELCRVLGVDVSVFADESQRIGEDESTLSEIYHELGLETASLVLLGNRRNSREIAMLAHEFGDPIRAEPPLPERTGRAPMLLKVPSLKILVTGVARYFSAHPWRSIGIICLSTHVVRDMQGRLTRSGLAKHTQTYVGADPYRNAVDFSTRPIRIVSTASMKGLEFDSVFVPDLDAYTEDPTGVEASLRFFVLCTRAREDLHLAYRGSAEPAIVSGVPEALLGRHVL
ncbi:DNA helicase [Streptomyces profundus]|uniref:DNA helicase n=1 Tax=Streptomyces profundus TaxID=2867410 RepID=UPI001D169750|nr:DNA helicase [Streptomyces sp. MA3_2.13]UED85477.1 DNA helicase [Streptomyces sp. MA3_2.13]